MEYKKVQTVEEARYCDTLLTKLVSNEKKYNDNIKDDYVVSNYFENLYDKNNCALFIAKDINIVGYIYVKIISSDEGPEKEHEALIDGLFVLEEYRNRGIATNLIQLARKWAIDRNAKYISLNVLLENESAKDLYYKMEFKDFSINLKQHL